MAKDYRIAYSIRALGLARDDEAEECAKIAEAARDDYGVGDFIAQNIRARIAARAKEAGGQRWSHIFHTGRRRGADQNRL